MVYDVAIIGAGLSGLMLAEQLLQQDDSISICIIHEDQFPNEEVAFKVGEATIETGAYYLRKIFGAEYMDNNYFIKMGMRFIESHGDSYNEMGPAHFPPNNSYQFERGKLENYAYDLLKDRVDILQNTRFLDVDDSHEVKKIEVVELGKDRKTIEARWLVDASGMKRVLSKKYNLSIKQSLPNSSVWFRVDGAVMVDDIYPAGEDSPFSHMDNRSVSSLHIDGKGYWIWVLRISETKTSVGIAFSEAIHKMEDLSTLEKTYEWLKIHEPAFYNYLIKKDFPILDFKYLKKYARVSSYCISDNRIGLTGDACAFVDPVYSGGLDIICLCNTMLTNVIIADRKEGNYTQYIEFYNQLLKELVDILLVCLHKMYDSKDNWYYIFLKYMVDGALYFGMVAPFAMNEGLRDFEKAQVLWGVIRQGFHVYAKTIDLINDSSFQQHEIPRFLPISVALFGAINANTRVPEGDLDQLELLLKDNVRVLEKIHEYVSENKNLVDLYWLPKGALIPTPKKWRYAEFCDADGRIV